MLQIYQSIYIALNQYIALYMCLFHIHLIHSLLINIDMHTPLILLKLMVFVVT